MINHCPYCDYVFEEHETIDGVKGFIDGDIAFCIKCGKAGEFRGNEVVPIDEQQLPIEALCEVDRIREAWRKADIGSQVGKK